VEKVTDFIREQRSPNYVELNVATSGQPGQEIFHDDKLDDAIKIVVSSGQASASYLQRMLRVGYARAASLIDMMEAKGIVGPKRGAKPREIFVAKEEVDC
jgi:S-DNA-T family DNA segregation ATPase FtsK/SpoIIIE